MGLYELDIGSCAGFRVGAVMITLYLILFVVYGPSQAFGVVSYMFAGEIVGAVLYALFDHNVRSEINMRDIMMLLIFAFSFLGLGVLLVYPFVGNPFTLIPLKWGLLVMGSFFVLSLVIAVSCRWQWGGSRVSDSD